MITNKKTIKHLRQLGPVECARRYGITTQNYHHWMNGFHSMKIETAIKIVVDLESDLTFNDIFEPPPDHPLYRKFRKAVR